MQSLVLKTESENADFYVASLAIGILEGMKTGGVPTVVGTWSLARPVFWEAMKISGVISSKLVDWVSSIDELEALEKLSGNAIETIDELLGLLKQHQTKALTNDPSLKITSTVENNS